VTPDTEYRFLKGGGWTICVVRPLQCTSRLSEAADTFEDNTGFRTFRPVRRAP